MAIKDTIILPFGIPKFIRSDNEAGMQNSVEFKQFLDNLSITLVPCSTASPWSNGAAERAIQTIKKGIRSFIQAEKQPDNWDEYIHIYTQSHNKSTNIHGFTPEELHFGFTNPQNNDIIQIWPDTNNTKQYIQELTKIANEKRIKAREKAEQNKDRSTTYRNQSRRTKKFNKGQLVLHRQLQVSTGAGGSLQPTFTGPYIIEEIRPQDSSATIEHMQTGRQMQAHFTNLQLFEFNPSTARLPGNFRELIDTIQIPQKYSPTKYYPGHEEVRESLNHIHKDRINKINKQYEENNQTEQQIHNKHHMRTRSKDKISK